MRAQTQYNHAIPLAGIKDGMQANVKPQLLDLRCTLKDGQIHAQGVAELNTVVEEQASIPVLADVAGVDGLQTRREQVSVGEWKPVAQDTMHLHETISAPGAQHVLLTNASTLVTNVLLDEDSAYVRGALHLSIMYVDENGEYQTLLQQIPFEKDVPMAVDGRSCLQVAGHTNIREIDISIGHEQDALDVDAVLLMQANCLTQNQQEVLSDAYAPGGQIEVTSETVEQLSAVSYANKVCTFSETVRLPEGLPDAYRAVYAFARPTLLGLANDNGQLAVDGIFLTGIIYQTDEGTIVGFEEDIPFRCTMDAPYMSHADIELAMLEARVNGAGRSFNVTLMLEVHALLRELHITGVAMDVERVEPAARENGILIKFASAGDTFFDTGKSYGVPLDKLAVWNPALEEPFEEGQPVLVLSGQRPAK